MENNTVYALSIANREFDEVNCVGAYSTIGGMLNAICDYAKDIGRKVVWDHFDANLVFLVHENNPDDDDAIVLFWDVVPLK